MSDAPATQKVTADYVQAERRGVVLRVPMENITHFTFSHKYAGAHYAGGELILSMSLVTIEEIVGKKLVRISRSCLAMRQHLTLLEYDGLAGGGWVTAQSPHDPTKQIKLRVSRRELNPVKIAMGIKELKVPVTPHTFQGAPT
ncbi:LytTR family DNA-binding domain-containing protein [Pseudomonas sp.]|uniref:LytTR family DNA-binding domain-containing protein n=1 Tax=Pseudomonas sp. TaxID=306 RepID=UPI003FD7978E